MGKKKSRGKQREEETVEAETSDSLPQGRRKGKKERLADPFFDELLPETQSSEVPEGTEVEGSAPLTKPKKKKKKREKGGKTQVAESPEDSQEGETEKGETETALGELNAAESESEPGSEPEDVPSVKPAAANEFDLLMEDDEVEEVKRPVISRQKAKTKKKTTAFDSAFAALEEDHSSSEEEHVPTSKPKAENAFASLMQEDEEEDTDDVVPQKKTEKKKTSSAFDSAFAALEEDNSASEEEEVPVRKASASNTFASLMEEQDEEEADPEPAPKKKAKKKKTTAAFDSAFAALEEENVEGNSAEDDLATTSSVPDPKMENSVDSLVGEDEVDDAVPSNMKTKKNKQKAGFESAFAALEEENTATQGSELQETKPKKSKKKKETSLNFDELMTEMDIEEKPPEAAREEAVTAQTEPVDEPVPEAEIVLKETDTLTGKEKKKAKKKKKGGKGQKEIEDIDAMLAEIDGDNKQVEKKADVASVEERSMEPPADSVHATIEVAKETVSNEPVQIDEESVEKTPAEEAAMTEAPAEEGDKEEADGDGEGEVKLTAAQKKKLRKKEKKAKDKEKEAKKSDKTSKGKEEKVPAHLKKIHEQLEKKKLEEEKRLLEEEAEKARIEEEERLKQEEERLKEEEARKKAEAKAKKEELKKQGLILTKKQKAEQARMALVREQLLKNSGISRTTTGTEKPALTPQEQKRIQREREEEKRRLEAERLKAEEEQREKEEAERKKQEEALAEQKRQEEEERKKREEEDAIADNWEDLSEEEDEAPEEAVPVLEEKKEKSSSEAASKSESSSGESSESSSDSESESGSDESSYSEDSDEIRERQVEEAKKKVEARIEEAKAAASADNLRSPICCILGHVDTGKTKILDNIRKTNVQDNEAGGITQQIGATYIPSEALQTRTADLRKGRDYDMKVPGLLVIDTPGHESFTNLRTRGSSLCDIAILVVDLMHGLEAQTVESIELLRQKKTPFIIALNKVDRLNDWKVVENAPIRDTLNRQKKHTMLHFEDRLQACTTMLMERGLNVSLYWKNKEPRRIVNMVPTSAITGEGIPDMLQLLIKLTTSLMSEKLMFLNEIQCSVLEVKAVEGLGTTIDVVLVNGKLNEGDKIVVCGMSGPIVTTVRSLLTPHPMKELRVKGSYLHHKSIQAAQGIKLCAQNLEHAVAGTALRVVRDDDEEECKLLAQEEMEEVMSRIDKSGEGVSVQASTLGSLEALLEFLKTPEVKIPVSAIAIGPVHKKDVMRANVMNEKKLKKFAVVLAFDVPVTKESRELAEELNVKIFTADIIYHLFDQFKAYVEDVRQSEKRAASADAVFPCVLSILPTCIFNKKDPIILGCEVKEGQARVGTPLVVPAKPSQGMVSLGRIESMELNHKSVQKAHRGDNVAVKIQSTSPDEASKLFGRHFDDQDQLISLISRESINALKAFFKDEMSMDDWNLVIKLKKVFQVE